MYQIQKNWCCVRYKYCQKINEIKTLQCVQNLKQMLQCEQNKKGQLRHIANESFQEYQFHNMDHFKIDFFQSLIHISEKTTPKSNTFQKILKQTNIAASSLLTFAQQIVQLISHKQTYSQSLLLAIYLSLELSAPVDLVTCDRLLRGVGHLITDETEVDRLSFAKETAAKEGIVIHNINSWEPHQWIGSSSVVIVDLFGLNPVEYRPFLLKHCSQLSKTKKLFLYHSHLQDDEVTNQLKGLDSLSSWLPLQLWPEHPLEYITQKDEQAMLDRLLNFLKQDSERPEKQDAVIFIPVNTHVKKFAGKLAEKLSKHHLKEQVNLISKPHKSQSRSKNNIFLVTSTAQLAEWDYDYSSLFYALDYETESAFRFDYALGVFVQSTGKSSGAERARRMAVVASNRIGRYACFSSKISSNLHYADTARSLSPYILKMTVLGKGSSLEFNNGRVAACLKLMESLGIIKREGTSVQALDKRVVDAAEHGVNPIEAKLVLNVLDDDSLQQEQKNRLANLMVMMYVACHSEGSLRQAKQQIESAAHIKPSGIWRKSGYLQSCLQILTKYDLIEGRKEQQGSKSQEFRRKTSKFNQNEYDVFGSLFEIIQPKKKAFEELDQEDFLREYTVNQELIMQVREEIFEFRDALGLPKVNIIIEKEDLYNVLRQHLRYNQTATAIYSGARRQGYRINNELQSIFPDKTSLISQLNERPECLILIRLSQNQNRYEILMSNSFSQEIYLEVFGKFLIKRSESQSELEIEFHGVSTSTFEELWKHNGAAIVKFETEYNCFVEPNQEMAMIIIHCGKENVEHLKSSFEAILAKIREKLSISNKILNYLGNTNISLAAGGLVKEIIKSNYIDKCLLSNLHLDVMREDLQELFDELFVLKLIELHQPEPGKYFKSAIITFNSQRDYYRFFEYFNECLYFDRMMDVKPLVEDRLGLIVKAKQYIEFKWFVWKSHNKAFVRFATADQASKAFEAFKQYPNLDGAQVQVTCQENDLIVDNLKNYTDEICIEEAMKGFGEVKEVQILKTPLKEVSGDDIYLESLIKNLFVAQNLNNPNPVQVQFKMQAIEKSKGGLRICRVHIQDLAQINRIANDLNKTTGKLGEGRLYAQSWFETPIIVPHGSMSIYQQILKEVFVEAQLPNISTFVIENDRKTYIVLKSSIKQNLDAFHQRLMASLQGYPMFLSDYEKSIILSEIGLANLLDLQEKYHCKLIVNEIDRTLHFLVGKDKVDDIKAEIKARVEDHFFYRLSLNTKAFRHFKSCPEKLNEIRTNYALKLVELEVDSKALLLEGSAINVQKAFNFLMHFIQSLTVPQESMINADVCGICCSEPHRPYRLQNCSHKFCRACLLEYINTVLGDISMFPIKCPHCFAAIVIDDLQCILQVGQWGKVLTLATNQYVTKHGEVMTFCFTMGCKQINMIKSDHIECDVCLATFCLECKMRYHPGQTCEQAKHGGDELFKQYMAQNKIRQCPNEKCKIPVDRVDGCYRVTCSRCNKSMCFKCEPDKMTAYDDYNACYKHLTDVHGGYW